ncbi:hypothetical protein OIE66_11975 [Nonomuraea sp. NBC_01738]|nr:hypothetical protein OIE66_11975 [Nonomuraea sp. NBC_01738]
MTTTAAMAPPSITGVTRSPGLPPDPAARVGGPEGGPVGGPEDGPDGGP